MLCGFSAAVDVAALQIGNTQQLRMIRGKTARRMNLAWFSKLAPFLAVADDFPGVQVVFEKLSRQGDFTAPWWDGYSTRILVGMPTADQMVRWNTRRCRSPIHGENAQRTRVWRRTGPLPRVWRGKMR